MSKKIAKNISHEAPQTFCETLRLCERRYLKTGSNFVDKKFFPSLDRRTEEHIFMLTQRRKVAQSNLFFCSSVKKLHKKHIPRSAADFLRNFAPLRASLSQNRQQFCGQKEVFEDAKITDCKPLKIK